MPKKIVKKITVVEPKVVKAPKVIKSKLSESDDFTTALNPSIDTTGDETELNHESVEIAEG